MEKITSLQDTQQMSTIGISFGALCDLLKEQLKKQGWKYDEKEINRFQNQIDAIHTLRFAGLLSDSVVDKLFVKLHKNIVRHVAKTNSREVIKTK